MDDLDVLSFYDDANIDSKVEPGGLHGHREIVILRLYPLEEATNVRDIGSYALTAYYLALIVQNAYLSVLFMYVQTDILHGSFRLRLLTEYRIGEKPLLTRHRSLANISDILLIERSIST